MWIVGVQDGDNVMRIFLATLIALLSILFSVPVRAFDCTTAETIRKTEHREAAVFVCTSFLKTAAILKDSHLSKSERKKKLLEILTSVFDVERLIKSSTPKCYSGDRRTVRSRLESFMLTSLAPQFDDYTEDSFRIGPFSPENSEFMLRGFIKSKKDGSEVEAFIYFSRLGGELRISDMQALGFRVSLQVKDRVTKDFCSKK
jgi:hypothetical protein